MKLAIPLLALSAQLIGHDVVLDSSGKILPWTSYDQVMQLAWKKLESFPLESNGLKPYFSYPRFEGAGENPTLKGVWWAHNPAGLSAMLIDSALAYQAYSGDSSAVELARELADHQLQHGTTPKDYNWAEIPYASAFPGSVEWNGADDKVICGGTACGRGDGVGFIEPDKVGELGLGYLKLFEQNGALKYRDAAVACATALAKHIRKGDRNKSPWPFRVDAKTGRRIREEYSANVIGPIKLFDEIIRLKLGKTQAYAEARKTAWDWLMKYPMSNHNWQGYFEDIPIHENPDENPNQYSALETVKYVLAHPEYDARWQEHAEDTLKWVTATFAADWEGRFGVEKGRQWGAEVLSEQRDDMAKMGSHTARFASTLALYAEKTGDTSARERAFRSFNWASYACSETGVVKVGTNDDEGYWFSDGYGDYMRHFLNGMASVPEWAPLNNHLLSSSTVVRRISYGATEIRYETFDAWATEVFKLEKKPSSIAVGGTVVAERADLSAEGYTVSPVAGGGFVVKLLRRGSNDVVITLGQL